MLDRWESLLRASLLGTERAPQLSPLPADLVGVHTDSSIEQTALINAAQLAALMRAGYVPTTVSLPTITAIPDTLAVVPEKASTCLCVLLREKLDELVLDWCKLAVTQQLRAPDHVLPELINALLDQSNLQTRLQYVPVIGQRGLWLAQQNPAWHSLIELSTDISRWELGTDDERIEVIRSLRAQDPVQARELIEQSHKTETAATLVQLVSLLSVGLSAADEPFLESLLDARNKSVRATAASLLMQLPGSALRRRMWQRLVELLQFTGASRGLIFKSAAKLEVTLPESADAALIRDGVDAQARWADLGTKAYMLAQILGGVELTQLEQHFSASADEIIRAAAPHEHDSALLCGFTRAAILQRNAAWASALVRTLANRKADQFAAIKPLDEVRLIALLDPAQREAAMRTRNPDFIHTEWVSHLSAALPHDWSPEFSQWALISIGQNLHHHSWHVKQLAQTVAIHSHPQGLRNAIQVLGQTDKPRPSQKEFVHILELRLRYTQELRHDE